MAEFSTTQQLTC